MLEPNGQKDVLSSENHQSILARLELKNPNIILVFLSSL